MAALPAYMICITCFVSLEAETLNDAKAAAKNLNFAYVLGFYPWLCGLKTVKPFLCAKSFL